MSEWVVPSVPCACCTPELRIGTCLYVGCCYPCARGDIAASSTSTLCHGSCCGACAMYTFCYQCSPILRLMDRTAIVQERQLRTEECGSCASVMCCPLCSNIQEYVEVVESKKGKPGTHGGGLLMVPPSHQQFFKLP